MAWKKVVASKKPSKNDKGWNPEKHGELWHQIQLAFSVVKRFAIFFLQGEINADQTILILSSSELRVCRMKDRLHHFFLGLETRSSCNFFSGNNYVFWFVLSVFYPKPANKNPTKNRDNWAWVATTPLVMWPWHFRRKSFHHLEGPRASITPCSIWMAFRK